MIIFEPQDHLHELKAAGLITEFVWVGMHWYITLPGNDLLPDTTTMVLRDDELEAYAKAMVHGALMATRLTPEQTSALHYYAKKAQ